MLLSILLNEIRFGFFTAIGFFMMVLKIEFKSTSFSLHCNLFHAWDRVEHKNESFFLIRYRIDMI